MARHIPDRLRVTARFTSGTNVVRACSVSATSTMSAEQACRKLAEKLWGPGKHSCTEIAYDSSTGSYVFGLAKREGR
ncbi:MAG: hypothetical protein KA179_00030 [Sulfuritalea sp.]|nr:hypothetical protein [Sulfuritalea sp.]